MANPKSKHTRHRTGIRRGSNWRLAMPELSPCPNCRKPRLPHKVCLACGFYGGRLVLAPKVKKSKKREGENK
ncbi:MAG: 50S ribosomal protein L32 [Elusimicrobiota bacterium]